MARRRVRELGDGRQMIDLGFRSTPGLVATYVLPEEDGVTLLETGPTSCREELLAGLSEAGIAPHEVRRVLVTHIHLDHAGGVGALAQALPSATFYAQEAGVPHLVDPTRLIESARRAWGSAADPLWGPILPLPADRVRSLRGGEELSLRRGRLRVLATPGHARHHLAFFDTEQGTLYTGDGAGVRLEGSWRARPAVPPPDLDLEALFASLEAMRALRPTRLAYTHFGVTDGGANELERYHAAVLEWRDAALAAAREEATVAHVAAALREHESSRELEARGSVRSDDPSSLVSGYEMAAMGLLRYFTTRGLLSASRA